MCAHLAGRGMVLARAGCPLQYGIPQDIALIRFLRTLRLFHQVPALLCRPPYQFNLSIVIASFPLFADGHEPRVSYYGRYFYGLFFPCNPMGKAFLQTADSTRYSSELAIFEPRLCRSSGGMLYGARCAMSASCMSIFHCSIDFSRNAEREGRVKIFSGLAKCIDFGCARI